MKAKHVFGNLLTTLSAKKYMLSGLFLSNYLSAIKKDKLISFITNQDFNKNTPSWAYKNNAFFPANMMKFTYIFNKIRTKLTISYALKIDLIINKMFTVFHPVAMFAALRFKSNITTEFMLPNKIISPT